MKTVSLFIICIFFSQSVNAQNTYYDAVNLSNSYKENGNQFDADDLTIFDHYFEIQASLTIANPEAFRIELNDSLQKNPFLEEFQIHSDDLQSDQPFMQYPSSVVASIGGLNVTTIADGAAQFLIERANEELNIMFFNRFKETIKDNDELQVLFPSTTDIVLNFEPYQYSQVINVLRSAFKDDLKEMVFNIESLTELNKYKELIETNDLEYIYFLLEGINMYEQLSSGVHMVDYIERLHLQKNVQKTNVQNITSYLKTVSIFSQSIRDISSADSSIYIPYKQLNKNLLSDQIAFQIYLGLIYQQAKNASIKFNINGNERKFTDILEGLNQEISIGEELRTYFLELTAHAKGIQEAYAEISKAPDSTKYIARYEFINNSIETIEQSLSLSFVIDSLANTTINDKEFKETLNDFVLIAKKSANIYKAVNDKNYFDLFSNSLSIYTNVIERNVQLNITKETILAEADSVKVNFIKDRIDSSFTESASVDVDQKIKTYFDENQETLNDLILSDELIKYGMFMVNLAEAETADEVKETIKTAALPAGSSSIKKNTTVSFFLNSYLGASGFIETVQESGNSFAFGLHAPIGPEVSFGFPDKVIGSISIFAPIIDIGALTVFRIDDENSQFDLPKITLDNILVFGGFLVFGIKNAPISVGAGIQKGPQLREIGTKEIETTMMNEMGEPITEIETVPVLSEVDWDFKLFVSVDIPIFKFYAKPRR